MILFPYANNVEYIDGELNFTLQFFDDERTVEIGMKIGLDIDLTEKIEELLEIA